RRCETSTQDDPSTCYTTQAPSSRTEGIVRVVPTLPRYDRKDFQYRVLFEGHPSWVSGSDKSLRKLNPNASGRAGCDSRSIRGSKCNRNQEPQPAIPPAHFRPTISFTHSVASMILDS